MSDRRNNVGQHDDRQNQFRKQKGHLLRGY